MHATMDSSFEPESTKPQNIQQIVNNNFPLLENGKYRFNGNCYRRLAVSSTSKPKSNDNSLLNSETISIVLEGEPASVANQNDVIDHVTTQEEEEDQDAVKPNHHSRVSVICDGHPAMKIVKRKRSMVDNHEPVSTKKKLATNKERRKEKYKEQDLGRRPWNLRSMQNVYRENNGDFVEKKKNINVKKKETSKFSISLTQKEMEEDYSLLTGSKFSKKSNKSHLDSVFPGSELEGISAHTLLKRYAKVRDMM